MMKFFGTRHAEGIEGAVQEWRDYQRHLLEIRERLPELTRLFVFDPSYHGRDYERFICPHDGILRDQSLSPETPETFLISIVNRPKTLLLQFHYRSVGERPPAVGPVVESKVWCSDEFDISDQGQVVHRILWMDGDFWQVVSGSVELMYCPLD